MNAINLTIVSLTSIYELSKSDLKSEADRKNGLKKMFLSMPAKEANEILLYLKMILISHHASLLWCFL